ncbi:MULTISPECIES: hypothetical protein [unclassified Oceanobacillus]|uniref:hypothetical protein n=1 Tax=unclassified Oceanobacillus TaxID=2630292 RepID=UPI00300E4B41
MEEKVALKEILNVLHEHSKQINEKMDKRFDEVDQRFQEVDKRFDEVDQRFQEVDKRFDEVDQRFQEVDKRFDKIDQKFDSLNQKVGGIRIELQETQETAEFAASKVIQHEKELRHINTQ